jgi:trk system potassium uptake protein
LFKGKLLNFLKSPEKNIFLIILLSSIIISLNVSSNFNETTFSLISAFTTTGYSLGSVQSMHSLVIALIITGMIIGGSVASTSGGIKIGRIYSLFCMIPWMIKKLSSPRHAIIPLKIYKSAIEESEIPIIIVFTILFGIFIFGGVMVFLILGYGLFDSLFNVVSALGTVGLQSIDLMLVPAIGKIVLILAMLLGRLEIFPLLLIFKKMLQSARKSFK